MLSWEIWTDVASQMQSRTTTPQNVCVRDLASTNDQIDFTRLRTCVRAFDGNLSGGRFCKLTASDTKAPNDICRLTLFALLNQLSCRPHK